MKLHHFTFILLASISFLVSCETTGSSGRSVSKHGSKTVYVVSDRPIDDYTIQSAIASELQKRGFRVIDSGDKSPSLPKNALVLHYMDTWFWDVAMYLRYLDIRIIDGNNSEIIASAKFKNGPIHTFANPQRVVSDLFKDMDRQKIF